MRHGIKAVRAEELNEARREKVRDLETLGIFEAYMLMDGQRVGISGNSKAAATVKVTPREGQRESGIRVFAVNEEGGMTEVLATCENG